MLVSSLCLVHCVGLPILLALLPFWGAAYAPNEQVHWLLTLIAVPVGGLALIPGYLRHREKRIVAAGFGGIVFMIAAPLVGVEWLEKLLTSIGGASLVGAHVFNRARCRCCHTVAPSS